MEPQKTSVPRRTRAAQSPVAPRSAPGAVAAASTSPPAPSVPRPSPSDPSLAPRAPLSFVVPDQANPASPPSHGALGVPAPLGSPNSMPARTELSTDVGNLINTVVRFLDEFGDLRVLTAGEKAFVSGARTTLEKLIEGLDALLERKESPLLIGPPAPPPVLSPGGDTPPTGASPGPASGAVAEASGDGPDAPEPEEDPAAEPSPVDPDDTLVNRLHRLESRIERLTNLIIGREPPSTS